MSDDINYQKKPGNGKVFAGIILLGVGGVLLLKEFGFFFPHWLISWPMLLIAWGLYSGAKHNWRNASWLILVLVGGAFLFDDMTAGYHLHEIVWPLAIIIFGIWLILRRNHRWDRTNWDGKNWNNNKWHWGNQPPQPTADGSEPVTGDASSTIPPNNNYQSFGDDYLDATSIFGGVKKTIFSKDFKGGEIVNIFGGAEIDFTQADINGRVIIDITQVFGGTKIIVPPHWQVISDLAAVFAGVDDKRLRKTGSGDTNKILVLKGVSIFAGVDIRSY